MKKACYGSLVAAGIGLAFMLVIVEIGLRLFSPFPLNTEVGNQVRHPVLAHIMDTRFPDIDADGFRNKAVLTQADIVAVGDSMTYGYNVSAGGTWPVVLGRLAGLSVYNYGIGQYGPLQYLALVEMGMTKHPRHMVVATHVPNDVADVCTWILELPYWWNWAKERGLDPSVCGEPLSETALAAAPVTEQVTLMHRVKMLAKKTALGGALDALVWDPYKDRRDRVAGHGNLLFEDGRNDTYITAKLNAYNIANTDLSTPANRFGETVYLMAFRDMAEKAKAAGVSFGVMFVPSRQSVMKDYLERARQSLPPDFLKSIELEYALENRIKAGFDTAGIRWVDSRDDLKRTVDTTADVYPFNHDNHPLAPGYAAMARTALPLVTGAAR